MNQQEIKEKLEAVKQELLNKIQNPNLTLEEKEDIQKSVVNYEYIIELADMNHFERGTEVR